MFVRLLLRKSKSLEFRRERIFDAGQNKFIDRKEIEVPAPVVAEAKRTSLPMGKDCRHRSGHAIADWAADRKKIEDRVSPLRLRKGLSRQQKEEN